MNARNRQSKPPKSPFAESSGNIRGVLEHAPVGMALVNTDNQITYANKSFLELLGYTSSDLTHLTLAAVSPTDKLSSAWVQFERLSAGAIDTLHEECQCTRKDGTLIWVAVSASAQISANERQIIVQLTDMEQQKLAEKTLAYKESRWNYALEAAGQGVWDHDIRAEKMFCSRMWKVMRGYGPDEELDSSVEALLERIHPDDRKRIEETVGKQDRGEEGFDTLEYREKHKDGHYIWIYSRGRPIEWSADGTAVRTVGTDTDVTRQKQVEALLAAEKERLRVTLQSLGEGVISTDAQAHIIFMNEIAVQMTGWQADDAIGRDISAVFRSELETQDGGLVQSKSVATCLKTGEICRPEEYSRMISQTGVKLFIRESAAPVRTKDGIIIGAVMVFQDTTSRRKLQEELTYSATHDSLTRLPNRLAFDAKMQMMSKPLDSEPCRHVLCLIDLDHFKRVNDEGGHSAGDALLKIVADHLRANCRQHDFASRIGGDEFAVILSSCSISDAKIIAQNIVDSISGQKFEWGSSSFKIGASIGLAPIAAGECDEDVVYRLADAACYEAKEKGRNRVVVASKKPRRHGFFK